MRIAVDERLNFRVLEGGREPLVFEPDVDWSSLAESSIINAY